MGFIPTFFCPVQTLWNLVAGASFLFHVHVKKQKHPGDEFEPYAFVQDRR